MANCILCSSPILSKYGKKFCSIRCSAASANQIMISVRSVWHTIRCFQCNVEFKSKDKRRKFCSHGCSAAYSNVRRATPKPLCENGCNKIVLENAKRFCSRLCAGEFTRSETIRNWQATGQIGAVEGTFNPTIRKYIFDKFSNKCSSCGWGKVHPITQKTPLQTHHRDGNSRNSREDNIELLCPNCHSLTLTYGSLNKGNGRKKRHRK